MRVVIKEKSIPVYSLHESSSTGSHLFEIVQACGEVKRNKADFLVPHRKGFYSMVLVKTGNSRHWVDGVPYTTKPNVFYFATPKQVHVKERSTPFYGTIVSFTEEFLKLEENKLLLQLPIITNPDNQHELSLTPYEIAYIDDIMIKMLAEFTGEGDWRNSMLLSYLRVLLIYVSRLYTERFENVPLENNSLIRKFLTVVDENFNTLHQVADYAQLFAMTPGHLSETVKLQSGKTAIEHIHDRIVMEAKRHLLHTSWSMKEVAYELGFEDAAYFSRFFKRITGETPAAYREAIRKMYQ